MPARVLDVFAAFQKFRASHANAFPGGCIGYEEATGITSGVDTETDLTDLSVTVTVGADRLIVVEGFVPRIASDTANDTAVLRVKEGATQLAEARVDVGATALPGNGGTFGYVGTTPFTVAAGSHTFKLAGALATGTGDIDYRAAASIPAWVRVIDVGPAF